MGSHCSNPKSNDTVNQTNLTNNFKKSFLYAQNQTISDFISGIKQNPSSYPKTILQGNF